MKIPMFIYDALGGAPHAEDLKAVREHMGNWIAVHNYIRGLPATRNSVRILAQMMIAEYQREPGPRWDIITRLYGRFSRVRFEVERVELGPRVSR